MNEPLGPAGLAESEPSARSPRATGSAARRAQLDSRERQFVDTEALAHVGSWEWDAIENRSSWSDEMCRIYGQPLGFAPTLAEFRALVHPDDRALIGGGGGERPHDMQRYDRQYRIVRPGGEIRHVHGRRDVRRDAHGRIMHMFGTTQDVTERRQAELARQEAQELFETAFSHAPIGMALIGLDGRWLKVNPAVCTITGWPEPELLRRTFQDITHPDDLEADLAQVERLLDGTITGYQIEKRYLTRTGSHIWALLSVSLVRDPGGRPRHFISQIEDISQRKHAEERLREAEAEARMQRDHARAIIGAMHEGYAFTVEGEIKAVNDALCAVTGFSAAQLIGSTPPYPFWAPELTEEMEAVRRRVMEENGGVFDVTFMRSSGERFEAELTAQPARDGAGRVIGFVSTLRDVSVQNRQHRELERLARTDSLTGLANRYVLQESLQREAGQRATDKQQLALVLLDLDLFKQINDEHGHPAGDAVLIEVARRLTLTVRAGEVLARVGGEEFAWLLPASSISEAVAAADRARATIASHPFAAVGTLTMSAGVGLMPTPSDGDELYRLADRALYEAKQNGRNRTCCNTCAPDGPALRPQVGGDDELDALVSIPVR
jgi:diguanylate cyclase (GGDEF)-like protein/PAS domain S-box-containing protein